MPRPRKYKDSGDRYDAFLENNPDYQKNYQQENRDRINAQKRERYQKNAPSCPRCNYCDARLKGEKSRALGICRDCQRAGKSSLF